jgi:hypothetical protein
MKAAQGIRVARMGARGGGGETVTSVGNRATRRWRSGHVASAPHEHVGIVGKWTSLSVSDRTIVVGRTQ